MVVRRRMLELNFWRFGVLVILISDIVIGVTAQTWCGKNYKAGSPVVPPGGTFPVPVTSSTPLLALRCAPAIRPYLPEDASSPSDLFPHAILIDAPITYSKISGAADVQTSSGSLRVFVSASLPNGTSIQLTTGTVALNTTKTALPFSLDSLTPSTTPYTLTCTARIASQTFTAQGLLAYLPTPPSEIGSVTRMDLRNGALLARPADGKGSGAYDYVLPVGFYTQFNPYLTTNLSKVDELKAMGINIIHPVPPFDNVTALNAVLDRMEQVGMYLMYDMRFTYMNSSAVTSQVNSIKSRTNLLLWYTGDEPDGTSDPLNATLISANLIASLDGGAAGSGGALGVGYHPVSLVLNCQDYYFTDYTQGANIVMQDAYEIGNNVTFSSQWGTVCTPDYGDCGCDNCKGEFEDISNRMDQFRNRLFVNGWERTKAVWTVPQGFGNDTYWKRYPTGAEFLIECILGINHGGLGVISWDDPTTPDIKAAASMLASATPQLSPFVLNPAAVFRHVKTSTRVDLGLWQVGRTRKTLILACNLNYSPQTVTWSELSIGHPGFSHEAILVAGANIASDHSGLQFDSLGCGGWVLTTPTLISSA